MPTTDSLATATVAIVLLALLVDHWRARNPESPVEAAQAAYERGDITLDELERRLDVHVDPRAAQLRESVERVNGVGPATSLAIAHEFESLQEVRAADRARLEDVPGVGPSTAAAIVDYLGE